MSILGLTLDFGPFGFLDNYNPSFIPNLSDDEGRYSFQNQPNVCFFNLEKLCVAMTSLFPAKTCSGLLNSYWEIFGNFYEKKMRRRLGLVNNESKEDGKLVGEMLNLLEKSQAD